jgi:D-sedoheptulose 7-phosphate isomerase
MDGSVRLVEAIKKAKHVYIIGNGGSYANAMHLCNDLLDCGVKAHVLDPASLTRTGNDESFDMVFARWIYTVAEPGDLVLALSGSGKSPNILNALEAAQIKGVDTFSVFGAYNEHKAENTMTAGKDMQRAEEYQVLIGHEVRKCLKGS